MNTQNWLSLMEYSALYKVSLSTLRRRIKAGEIEHKLIEGKYVLKNAEIPVRAAPAEFAPAARRPSPAVKAADGPLRPKATAAAASAPAPVPLATPTPLATPASPITRAGPVADQFWDITQALLAEIKNAFALAVREKDVALARLNGEVGDLKTLVQALEMENEKLRLCTQPKPGAGFDLGLDV